MLAGKTNLKVGTKIRITAVSDKEDNDLIGLTGEITHPFGGLMAPGFNYVAGVRLDQKGLYNNNIVNLTVRDKFEVIE